MRLWLILIGALLVQEIATTSVVLLSAHQAGYSILLITLIFILATTFDLVVGYMAGKWVQQRFGHSRLVKWGERTARRFHTYLGKSGSRATLVLVGFVSYAYINSFLASWLEIPPREAALWLFIGDLGWFALEWLLVLGIHSTGSGVSTELYLSVGISILFIIGIRFIAQNLLKRE
jgi:membrane protein YqaA with SNARE-associated domain